MAKRVVGCQLWITRILGRKESYPFGNVGEGGIVRC